MQPIIETKLYRPRLTGDYIPRNRLSDRLDYALAADSLALVSAPAGYGKTTAVVAWLDQIPEGEILAAAVWYSLDESDDSLGIFLAYLVAAVERAMPHAAAELADLLRMRSLLPVSRSVAAFTQACERLPGPLILVLDDYHVVTDADIHQFIVYLVRYRPAKLHLVIIARSDPPLPLGQWRARNQLLEVRAEDLAFTPEESSAFLRAAGADLTPDAARLLYDRTEGWPVGLRLATISLRDPAGRDEVLATLGENSQHRALEYLVDEVLNRLPEGQHAYLLQTCILDRLHCELCAAVLATEDTAACQRGLEWMHRANLFLIPLDTRREWYRYHSQFQAMLRQRLRAWLPAGEIAALHRRAAGWYAAHDFIDDALGHYQAAGDVAAMLALVESVTPRLEHEDRWDRLGHHLNRLPQDALLERPALLLARAWYQMVRMETATLVPLLDRVEALLQRHAGVDTPEGQEALWGDLHALRSSSYFGLTPDAVRAHVLAALAALPADRFWARAYAFSTWVYITHAPREWAAFQTRIRAELAIAPQLSPSYELRLLHVFGFSQFRYGSLADMEQTCRRFVALAERLGVITTWVYGRFCLGAAQYYRHDPAAAVPYLEDVITHRHVVGGEVLVSTLYLLVAAYQAKGETAKTATMLEQAAEALTGSDHQEELEALRALARLLGGDLAAAVAWADAAPHTPATLAVDTRALVLARVRLAEGRRVGLAQAAAALDGYLAALETAGERRQRIHALALRAQLHWERGETRPALDRLAEAIDLGYARGYRRWYVEQGPVMGQMLHALAREGRLVAETGALLALLAATQQARPRPEAAPGVDAIEPLSEREMDILELIAAGLSNKQIAFKLNISPLTVRNHASNLFAKLDVGSRRQAVARAQALGLLP